MADLQKDWERIKSAALQEKQMKALEKWFKKARKDVYISVDPAYNYCGILDD
jgi:peptidyl-prolyl cis-trans isomerase SurA